MKRIVIHIGPHKTASTFLQSNMKGNSSFLTSQGVCYPTEMFYKGGHHMLPPAIRKNSSSDFEGLLNEIDNFEKIVFSSETFSRMSVNNIKRLSELFTGYDVQILFFYRSLYDVLPSQWQERIKQGFSTTWPEYFLFASGNLPLKGLTFPLPDRILRNWSEVFGFERLNIFSYATLKADPKNALKPICDLLDLDIDGFTMQERGRNESYLPERIEAIRSLNLSSIKRGMPIDGKVRRAYMKRVKQIEKSDVYDGFLEHFKRYSMVSTLGNDNPYMKLVHGNVMRTYGDRFMSEIPELAAKTAHKRAIFLDPSYPIPKQIIEALEQVIS